MPAQPTRFLIVRLSAIGDCVHSLPLVCALREAHPDSYIAWLVEGRAGDLLEGHPALDRVIRVPRKWLKQPKVIFELRRTLRRERFDVAIDPQGLTKSAVAAWLSGARRRIGFRGVDGRELSPWLNSELVEPQATHVVDRNLELLGPLGISSPAARFDLPETARDGQFADKYLHECKFGQQFAVINPGAGWPSKLWCPDRFAQVARHLGEQRHRPSVVVWGGDSEKAWAEEIASKSGGHARVAPPTSLTELTAIIRRSCLFVSSDTGPLHIAAAVGTPCIGLFGPMPGERNGPYGDGHIVLQKARLTGTSRQRRSADNSSMLAISAADVCIACNELLNQQPAALHVRKLA